MDERSRAVGCWKLANPNVTLQKDFKMYDCPWGPLFCHCCRQETPFPKFVKLNAEFRRANSGRICTQTVRNRLYKANLKFCRPAVRPVIKLEYRRNGLHWAIKKRNWQRRHWCSVHFSDGSRFCVQFNDGRRLDWKAKGEICRLLHFWACQIWWRLGDDLGRHKCWVLN